MGTTTPKLGLYKPGGGSSGLIQPPEQVDIDKINANMDKIDDAIGGRGVTSTTRPASPYDGQVIYETDTGNLMLFSQGLNRWIPQGVPNAASDTLRNTLYPSPTQGTQVNRTDKGWVEQYFTLFNATTNPVGANPAGWYPVAGLKPYAEFTASSGSAVWSESPLGTSVVPYAALSDQSGWHGDASNPTRIKPGIAGRYRITVSFRFQNSGSPTERFAKIIPNGDTNNGWQISSNDALGLPGNAGSVVLPFNGSSDYFVINGYASGLTTSAAFRVLVEYLGPNRG